MIFGENPELRDLIIELLAGGGGATIKSLHAQLKEKKSLSLRAVYKAVDKLVDAGVILKIRKQIMLDQEWVARVGKSLRLSPLHSLAEGERISYTLGTMEHLDALWKTVVLPLEEVSPEREIFFYNPHNFWAYLPERKASENAYYQRFIGNNRNGFFTVGGDSVSDKEFKRSYQNKHLQIDLREITSIGRRAHITILGALIITARLPKATAARIDGLYASQKLMNNILSEIMEICRDPGILRLTIENNPRKATRLKNVLSKNFYLTKKPPRVVRGG